MQRTDTICIFHQWHTWLHYAVWVDLDGKKGIVKVGTEISETKNRKTIQKINEIEKLVL